MISIAIGEAHELVKQLKAQIEQAVYGQEHLIDEALCCMLAGGHILMTGAPGLAKTTLVRVFARHLGLNFGRVQFTPDLLPADIIGFEILNIDPSGKRSFEFSKGPIFTNLLLADEINRASPRTQSALLEAMQERTCTIAGKVHPLTEPFMVFATQNPFESEGTFPLPEAQLDRFLVHSLVDYTDLEAEKEILMAHAANRLVGEKLSHLQQDAMLSHEQVMGLLDVTRSIKIDERLVNVVCELVRATRPGDDSCPHEIRDSIWYGAGPRAGISLVSLSQSLAVLQGSEEVRWHHVKRMAAPTLRHRIRLTAHAARDEMTPDRVVHELIERIEGKYKFLAKGVA